MMDEGFEARITRIGSDILGSYNAIGGINDVRGPNLPSRLGVVAILESFESLIFPGFQSQEGLNDDLPGYTIGARTRRLVRDLTVEVSRSLEYSARIDGGTVENGACRRSGETIALDMLGLIPRLRERAMGDVEAALRGDPAAKSREEVILSYPGVEAVVCHRVAHELYVRGVPLIPRIMSEHVHGKTGIDIHPGASIDDGFFIDHATGVVVGETAVIGRNVKLYQGVTIGALSVTKELADEKRHPTIEDDVTIYAGATILGGKTVIGRGAVIGGNVWITASVPAFSVVYNRAADYRTATRGGGAESADHWMI